VGNCIRSLWAWLVRYSHRQPRCLRLCESLPLGDRRFVAVIEYDGAQDGRTRFLVGGTPSSLVMLARLAGDGEPGIEKERPH
jgi:hypothetical protein